MLFIVENNCFQCQYQIYWLKSWGFYFRQVLENNCQYILCSYRDSQG